jgi:hypothetical protein
MGMGRARKNRRLKNRNVLDVKLRTRGTRLARVRLVTTALGVAVGMLVGLYGLWKGGEWALDRLVFQNESFAVRSIQVHTDGVIPPEEIVRWSGVRVGDNLLGLDMTRVRRDLELAPLIRSAAVERVPPDILRIRVSEREPIARVMTLLLGPAGGGVSVVPYYLDADGHVMDGETGPGWGASNWPRVASLPVLEGVPLEEVRSGRAMTIPGARAALRLISEFERSSMAGWVILESVDVTMAGLLEVRARAPANGHVSRVRFGYEGTEEQLRRWHRIHEYGRRRGEAIGSLDLSVRDNTPVVFVAPGVDPDRAAGGPPQENGRQRHV